MVSGIVALVLKKKNMGEINTRDRGVERLTNNLYIEVNSWVKCNALYQMNDRYCWQWGTRW